MQISTFDKMVSILMPAYNEEQNIERVVRKCIKTLKDLNLKGEVIVTNDGSIDKTQSILTDLEEEFGNLVTIHHSKNKGYGQALNNSIKASRGDIVVTIDSDGQFDIGELPLLLDLYKQGNKIVAGYRKEKKDSAIKVFANKVLILLTNCMFGLKLRDCNSAFKLYEASALKSFKIESTGYPTPTEIMVKLKTLGYSFVEVGITHTYRQGGKSALGLIKTTLNMLIFLFYLRLKVSLFRRRIINSI